MNCAPRPASAALLSIRRVPPTTTAAHRAAWRVDLAGQRIQGEGVHHQAVLDLVGNHLGPGQGGQGLGVALAGREGLPG